MASPYCRGCLSRRPSTLSAPLAPSTNPSRAAPFHTTPSLHSVFMKKKNPNAPEIKYRRPTAFRMKRKKPVDKPRPPPPGERRALQKRIVLSNPNALEVEGLQDFSVVTMIDSKLHGSVLGLPLSMLDRLRTVQAFQPTQGWSVFRRPGTVVRSDTLEMGRTFERITNSAEDKGRSYKKIISGVKGSGKTVHLLQAMTMAFLNRWVVFTIPDGKSPFYTRTVLLTGVSQGSGQRAHRFRPAPRLQSPTVHSVRSHGGLAFSHRFLEQRRPVEATCVPGPSRDWFGRQAWHDAGRAG